MNTESTPTHPITVVDATSPGEARAELVRQVVDAVLRAHGDEAFVTESITELHARRPEAELPASGRIEVAGVVRLPRREVARG